MQQMAGSHLALSLVLVLELAIPARALLLTVQQQSSESAGLLELQWQAQAEAYARAESDDRQFLQGEWEAAGANLQQLLDSMTEVAQLPHAAGLLQESNVTGPTSHKTVASKSKGNETAVPAAEQLHALLSNAGGKGLAGKAMLAPALEMLKGLYSDQKKRITEVNKREETSKTRFTKQKQDHDRQIQRLKDLYSQHKISEGLYKNSTHDADRMFSYWEKCRERNHRQFHTSLKISHGMMSKVDGMVKSYEKALAEPTPSKAGAQEFAKMRKQVAPEIVFLQEAVTLVDFCRDGLKTVAAAKDDLSKEASFSFHN